MAIDRKRVIEANLNFFGYGFAVAGPLTGDNITDRRARQWVGTYDPNTNTLSLYDGVVPEDVLADMQTYATVVRLEKLTSE
ncbi:MAG: hypothetical protein AABX14_04700 [Candidatus Aenigmatarchaeota archaeon]